MADQYLYEELKRQGYSLENARLWSDYYTKPRQDGRIPEVAASHVYQGSSDMYANQDPYRKYDISGPMFKEGTWPLLAGLFGFLFITGTLIAAFPVLVALFVGLCLGCTGLAALGMRWEQKHGRKLFNPGN